ncbi:Replicase polyprotein 1a [Frankliniella fusca]|uniref:Replicase polyprotein 1a n=1 Tax=Frankliniella fusca TaxID=407009 RepID=A0AAE1HQ83_9NEOP|nr:Replicase polyprotein 1a [Frankliniella fusca]
MTQLTNMSPQEMKELPKDELDDQNLIGVLISDDEDIDGNEPEPPEEELDPDVDVEDEEVDDVLQDAEGGHADEEGDEQDEDEDEDEEVEDEEDVDDDEDDDSSEGRKEEDDDSDDDEDDDHDKRPFNDSDDQDEDDDDDSDEGSNDDGGTGRYNIVRKARISARKSTFGRGKVMPGVSFPLTANQEYKGDIEDLIRAAAQAEEGETSASQEDHSVPKITIKVTTDEIECGVVGVIEVENDSEELEDRDEEEVDRNFRDMEKGLILEETHAVGDDEDPPHKRIKNS